MDIQVDFIAGHPLQAQAAASVFTALQERATCRWLIGRPSKSTGAMGAVFVDHMHHHPNFSDWEKTFYMLHDLGDVDVYDTEREALRQFSAVIVPDAVHAAAAKRYVERRWWHTGTAVWLGGWPKYDERGAGAEFSALFSALAALPERPTILYAPTWAAIDEWRTLLPLLTQLPVNVVIKNHPYATAPGELITDLYRRSKESVAAMEMAAREFGQPMLVAPAALNICTLFPYVDAVISDQSSVVAEFLPWGLAIETGANPKGAPAPGISGWYPAVQYRPLKILSADLETGGPHLLKDMREQKKTDGPHLGAGKKTADKIWEVLCSK